MAVLGPLPEDPLERLRAAGDLLPASGELDELPQPLVLAGGQDAPSLVLARLRSDER